MATDDPRTLVSTDWLAAHLNDPDLRILDASWHMPATGRDAPRRPDPAMGSVDIFTPPGLLASATWPF